MHCCLLKDDAEEKQQYRMYPADVKTMTIYKEKKKGTVCCGCGVELVFGKNKKKMKKASKAWRGYVCNKTQREFIFHSRLCVKLRKAKEWIRDAVYNYNVEHGIGGGLGQSRMQIDFIKNEELEDAFQPTSFYTTFDETQKRKGMTLSFQFHPLKPLTKLKNFDLLMTTCEQSNTTKRSGNIIKNVSIRI